MVHSQLNECSTIFNSLIGVGNPFFCLISCSFPLLPSPFLFHSHFVGVSCQSVGQKCPEKQSQVIYLFNPFHFEAISSLFLQLLQMLLIRAKVVEEVARGQGGGDVEKALGHLRNLAGVEASQLDVRGSRSRRSLNWQLN